MKKNLKNISDIVRQKLMNVNFKAKRRLRLYIAILLFGSTIAILGACTKFLTEDLKGTFSSDTYYQNDKQALQAITGVYNALTFTNSDNVIWVFGDVASDDAVKGGNPGDQADITYIDEFSANSTNGMIINYWTFVYEAVARATASYTNVQ